MNIICVEETAFYTMIENIIEQVREKIPVKPDKWISSVEAMNLLRIKSKTTLQKLRDEGKIVATQPGKIVLYDRGSIIDYLDDFIYETF